MSAFLALVRRDLDLALRLGGGGWMALIFFAGAVTLTPFGLGPDLKLLGRIAPGMLFMAAALASLIALDRLFQADYEDGSLDQLLLAGPTLELAVLAKCLAHWLTTGLPLVLASPVLALMLNAPPDRLVPLALSLALGTPAFTLLGAIGAGLAVSVRRGGLIVALMVLPLYVPVVIFGVGTSEAAALGEALLGPSFLLLAATSLAALALAPLATAAALRASLS